MSDATVYLYYCSRLQLLRINLVTKISVHNPNSYIMLTLAEPAVFLLLVYRLKVEVVAKSVVSIVVLKPGR